MCLIALTLSIGGWFLWNIILSAIYPTKNKIYTVKHGFFDHFGRNILWWLTLVLILSSVIVFELGVASLRAAWFPTDVDIFQELERDLEVRKRFEEASALELQQGWDRGRKKGSLEVEREKERVEKEREEQEQREGAVRELLQNRPDGVEAGARRSVAGERGSADVDEAFRGRFGSVHRNDSLR
jgi:phospholipid-translocating ATPase